jgi:hypothetical protein
MVFLKVGYSMAIFYKDIIRENFVVNSPLPCLYASLINNEGWEGILHKIHVFLYLASRSIDDLCSRSFKVIFFLANSFGG